MRYVGLVRNIMIGREGMHRVRLLERLEQLGAEDPVSFISTGNFAFDLAPEALPELVGRFESWLLDTLGRPELLFVRELGEVEALVDADPFGHLPEEAIERGVSFAKTPLAIEVPWTSKRGDAVIFRVAGREAYGHSRMVAGRTTGFGGYVERLAGQRVTTRGFRTLERIVRKERERRG